MAKTLYKAKFKDKLPLGGIATGYINLGCDASISLETRESSNLSFFAIKAEKDGVLTDARVLQASKAPSSLLAPFEKAESACYFPFTEICFSDSSFPADIKMTAFSPFIPLNDTDSGIPAVHFEFEITNTACSRLDFSIGCASQSMSNSSFNRMGCTETGEAYILLSGDEEASPNTCIATNGKNVSFCEYTNPEAFTENFTRNPTLYNSTKSEFDVPFPFGALCTHFSLNRGEKKTVSFCLSWYLPRNEFSRNYYAQYFESSLECASYLFRQSDRLRSYSLEFSESIFTSTLNADVLEEIGKDLFSLISAKHTRLDNGEFISAESQRFSNLESFISRGTKLSVLFPNLEYSELCRIYKNNLYESLCDDERLLLIIRSYRHYLLSSDLDALIEDWYDIVKCMQSIFGENRELQCVKDSNLKAAAIRAFSEMAEAVKDKKRQELYSSLTPSLSDKQASSSFTQGFKQIAGITGFSYKANTKQLSFSPDSDSCPLDDGGTFRCFFCTHTCYGYVEEGIDYIEIKLLHGKLLVRSFGVPRTPRLVQYGGRNWRFEDTGLCALLDSVLEVTPQKKLTILIDIKQ